MTIARCQLHGEELEGEWEDNPPATKIVANSDGLIAVPDNDDWFDVAISRSLWLCESCYEMIQQYDLHLVPMEVPLWS